MFHLFTHAFFKALLFLGAGSVIHAMHHEQDMRNMGGLRRYIPFTYGMMAIGTLALTGLSRSPPAIFPRTRSSRRPLRRTARARAFAFVRDGRRRLHDLVLFLAPVLHDLRGQRALGRMAHEGHGAHEGVEHDAHSHDVEPPRMPITSMAITAITRRTRARS